VGKSPSFFSIAPLKFALNGEKGPSAGKLCPEWHKPIVLRPEIWLNSRRESLETGKERI
jgi:hypothetical protein